jgi:hypothetical protein
MMLRAASSIAASTSSFTALALAPGALNTGTPRWLMSSTGMLFTPAPQRPIAFTDVGISESCSAWERSTIASASASALPTVYPAWGKRSRPRAEIAL